jgi:hypothetical protein
MQRGLMAGTGLFDWDVQQVDKRAARRAARRVVGGI